MQTSYHYSDISTKSRSIRSPLGTVQHFPLSRAEKRKMDEIAEQLLSKEEKIICDTATD